MTWQYECTYRNDRHSVIPCIFSSRALSTKPVLGAYRAMHWIRNIAPSRLRRISCPICGSGFIGYSTFGCMPPLSISSQPIALNPSTIEEWIAVAVSTVARRYVPSCRSNLFNVATPMLALDARSAVDHPRTARAALIVLPDILLISMIAPMATFCLLLGIKSTQMIDLFHSWAYHLSHAQVFTRAKKRLEGLPTSKPYLPTFH